MEHPAVGGGAIQEARSSRWVCRSRIPPLYCALPDAPSAEMFPGWYHPHRLRKPLSASRDTRRIFSESPEWHLRSRWFPAEPYNAGCSSARRSQPGDPTKKYGQRKPALGLRVEWRRVADVGQVIQAHPAEAQVVCDCQANFIFIRPCSRCQSGPKASKWSACAIFDQGNFWLPAIIWIERFCFNNVLEIK
jgi:hypothetical protein